ncbi:hypothetical protein FOMPIDRAFT_1035281 [Fomitopsis schrenkii]|uniref:RRM domain-containing protein n=1 Tax=Fomitopsis schrenkii TaxID=2126942 RepID=S8EF65_FOMSC|nr:hypothetical protein FOMPIDRAFT_1035281 [Fomitopsis schrenkii]
MSSSSSSSSSVSSSNSEGPVSRKDPRAALNEGSEDESDSSASSSTTDGVTDSASEQEEDEDNPVLSHKDQRRQKKKELKQKAAAAAATLSEKQKGKQPVKNSAELAPSKLPRRQHSVWVGNLAFKTTPDALRRFFDGVGEITRIHMPMKMASGGPGGGAARKESRGFAYVDFATPDAKTVAITLSENPLDGRRLLIKDGDDFNGRPAPAADTDPGASGKPCLSGHTKTAQKILRAQKHPAGPTLFLGNLGFETTDQSVRQLFDSHRAKPPAKPQSGADSGAEEIADAETDAKPKPWIRKVRMGTFEDSGKCKGWAFVDFANAEYATDALVNPKNHFLDGRKLVIEYASPDAVRRGGNIPRSKGEGKRDGAPGANRRERQPRTERTHANGEAPRADRKRKILPEDADVEQMADHDGEDASRKKQRTEDWHGTRDAAGRDKKPPRARPKPGAALALAKRETAAIVPAQGRKIVF